MRPSPLDLSEAPVPAYGVRSLSDLLPAIAAGFRLTAGKGRTAIPATELRLDPAERVCVLLVDGLGAEQLRDHAAYAPFLAGLLGDGDDAGRDGARVLTAGFPSTTATSLASFGTGLPAGRHGLAGYTVAVPGRDVLMNQLRWEPWTDPVRWQPHPTVFGMLHARGVHTAQVLPSRFATTALTLIAVSGGRFVAADDADERMDRAARELGAAGQTLVYTYLSDLDAAGHQDGVDSDTWRDQLIRVDRLAQRLANRLPPRSALYVTSDHGMVDVAPDRRVDYDHDPALRGGVALLGGEARARHVYTSPGAAADVHAAWRESLGDRMWVATRDEAVEAGWFGPRVDDRVLPRIGDVVAVAHGDVAVVATESEPGASAMVGLHGALTSAELTVPLLQVRS
ncbi:nucleotide pyrophosphatase/phosphodiesterase family protein [Streptomyces sp. NPDC038707]|uniref:alkaline phosphatase family protein n=1 Tax=Streptomyces sp. NPDC038707 TaxID=3154329 RepID=UPI0033CF1E83